MINEENVNLVNFKIDASAVDEDCEDNNGLFGAGVAIQSSNVYVGNFEIKNCRTNGFMIYGDGANNIIYLPPILNQCSRIFSWNEISFLTKEDLGWCLPI